VSDAQASDARYSLLDARTPTKLSRVRQETLTLLTPLRDPARARKVVEELARDTTQVGRGTPQPSVFAGLGIHFARIVVIDEASTSPYPASLVVESNFDTDEPDPARARRRHLSDLAAARGDELTALWSSAEAPLPTTPREREEALVRALVPYTAAYQGHVYRDLARIESELAVREAAMRAVSQLPYDLAPEQVFARVRAAVTAEVGTLDWSGPPPALPDPHVREQLLKSPRRAWLVEALPFLAGGVATLPLSLALIALLLLRERTDRPYAQQTEAESMGPELLRRLAASAEHEDFGTQNALTHLVPVRGGVGRRLTLRITHAYLKRVAQEHFNYVEQLGGIPSIHFAKWLLVDGGRRLLFLSNYDGSWESYLGDFVDQAALGLNLAWLSTEGYPNTRFVAGGGANDEETFKSWARVHQRPTELFYAAYPTLSVADVNNNTWLRHGLHAGGPRDLSAFLRRLT